MREIIQTESFMDRVIEVAANCDSIDDVLHSAENVFRFSLYFNGGSVTLDAILGFNLASVLWTVEILKELRRQGRLEDIMQKDEGGRVN